MKKTIWVAQIILALAFLMAGATKLFTPYDELVLKMAWAEPKREV